MSYDAKGKYTYEYPRPAMTADCVIFGFDGEQLKILLIERGVEPFKGSWALPGGFMKMDETIEQCAIRELREETNLSDVYLEQFKVFSGITRDPRGRVVTIAFIALVRPSDYKVIGGDDASNALWFNARQLPPLAFDHYEIIECAIHYLREILKLRPVAFRLLDDIFSVDELRKVYEVINDTQYDRRNFQRKLMQSDVIVDISPEPEEGTRPQRRYTLADRFTTNADRATTPSDRFITHAEIAIPHDDISVRFNENSAAFKEAVLEHLGISGDIPSPTSTNMEVEEDLELSCNYCCEDASSEIYPAAGKIIEEHSSENATETKNSKKSKRGGSIKDLFNF